jgi:hypothetical protein
MELMETALPERRVSLAVLIGGIRHLVRCARHHGISPATGRMWLAQHLLNFLLISLVGRLVVDRSWRWKH